MTCAQADSLQQQIDQQVWKPFIQSFASMDTKAFMAVHSKDMTRVIQDGNTLYGYERYYHENEQGDLRNRKSGQKRTIELRFIQRIAGDNKAFEVGYYKTTVVLSYGKSRSGYGKFHVLLRKENGTWKILMDADASEKTNEAIFLTGKPIQSLN
jgi:ketosteroid isomerase-like protein